MKNRIAIYGAGGFGREVACLLRKINEVKPTWDFVGFYDDGMEIGSAIDYGHVLGGMAELNAVGYPLSVVVAMGSPKSIKHVVEQIHNPYIDFPNIISPDAKWLDEQSVTMGKGNVVAMGNYFSCNVHIGNFNMLVGFSTIGHDATLGDFNCLMPGVRVSGNVTVGNENMMGSGAIILQGLSIGNEITIGAGSTLMTNPKDGATYLGCPAKKIF
ncbi:MAG: serine acetyltransferase [Sodaliphilus sp.]